MKRVQVRDLPAPEEIQPTPIKRDTYVRVTPGHNPNWDYLMRGLSAFKQGAMHMAGVMEKKRLEEYQKTKWAEYQAWRAATSNADQVKAIRTGKDHWSTDPIIGAAVRKDYGQMEAQALGQEIDQAIAAREINLANPDFNIEKYVLEKAAPYVERLKTNVEAISAFRAGMDTVRNGLMAKHQKARGEAAVEKFEDIARKNISAVFDLALEKGHLGDSLMDAVRGTYKDLGPRTKGGAFDISYRRMDELTLDVLKEKAQDPRFAQAVIEVLHADRRDVETRASLGPLSSSAKHASTVREIIARATKTRDSHWEKQTKEGLTLGMMQAFGAADGSFQAARDLSLVNPFDDTKRIKISASELQKEATIRWLDAERRKSGLNLENEANVFMRNDVAHPLVVPQLKEGYFGVFNMNYSNGKPGVGDEDRLAAVVSASDTFAKLHRMNPVYLEKHLGKDATRFYSAVTALRETGVANPKEAVLLAIKGAQNPAQTSLSGDQYRKIEETVAPGGGLIRDAFNANSPVLRRQVADAVLGLTRYGVPFDTALEQVKTSMEKNAVNINGHMVWGVQNVSPATAPVIKEALNQMFIPNQMRLKAQGITSPDQLTVVNQGGNLYAANAETGRVIFVTRQPNRGGPGEPEQLGPAEEVPLGVITNRHLTIGQAALERVDRDQGIAKTMRRRDFYDMGRELTREMEKNLSRPPQNKSPSSLGQTIKEQSGRVRQELKRFNEDRSRTQPREEVGDN